jgi:hypothetical protein
MSRIKTNAYTPPVDCRSASFFAKITGQEPGTFFTRARQTWFERVNGIPAACSSSASDHLVSALATPEWIATGTEIMGSISSKTTGSFSNLVSECSDGGLHRLLENRHCYGKVFSCLAAGGKS